MQVTAENVIEEVGEVKWLHHDPSNPDEDYRVVYFRRQGGEWQASRAGDFADLLKQQVIGEGQQSVAKVKKVDKNGTFYFTGCARPSLVAIGISGPPTAGQAIPVPVINSLLLLDRNALLAHVQSVVTCSSKWWHIMEHFPGTSMITSFLFPFPSAMSDPSAAY